jgi:hypothetical protein
MANTEQDDKIGGACCLNGECGTTTYNNNNSQFNTNINTKKPNKDTITTKQNNENIIGTIIIKTV